MRTSASRDIIHDTHATSITEVITGEAQLNIERGNNIEITPKEYKQLSDLFKQLGEDLHKGKDRSFVFAGNHYDFVPHESKISVNNNKGIRADIALKRTTDNQQQWIVLTYSLYIHNKSNSPLLAFIGNPTTLLNGNNITPIRVEGLNSANERLMFYQVGFYLIEELLDFRWSGSRGLIDEGLIKVSNTQWALYLPTKDSQIDLALLAGLYAASLIRFKNSSCLAELLGFDSASKLKNSKGELTGLFLTKKKGSNHVLTVNFYDKRQSIANKKQGKSVSQDTFRIIDNTIRLDITAHSSFLESMIVAARDLAEQLKAIEPRYKNRLENFLMNSKTMNGQIIVNAANISWTMTILGYKFEDGAISIPGFTSWLLNRVLEEELRLFSLLEGKPDGKNIPTISHSCYGLFKYWYDYKGDDLIEDACAFLKVSKSTIYDQRKKLRADFKLDVLVPRAYWTQLDLLSSVYGLSDKKTERFVDLMYNMKSENIKEFNGLLKKSTVKFNQNKDSLLTSLKLVAKQIPATPVNLNKVLK